jgi:hypothetical protein
MTDLTPLASLQVVVQTLLPNAIVTTRIDPKDCYLRFFIVHAESAQPGKAFWLRRRCTELQYPTDELAAEYAYDLDYFLPHN